MEGLLLQPTYGCYNRRPSAEVMRCIVNYADGKQEIFGSWFGDEIGPVVGAWPTETRILHYRGRQGMAGYCFRAVAAPARFQTHLLCAGMEESLPGHHHTFDPFSIGP